MHHDVEHAAGERVAGWRWSRLAAGFASTLLLLGVAVHVGCASRSGAGPAPEPRVAVEAERLARQAAKLQSEENWNGAVVWWHRAGQQYGLLNREADVALAQHNEGVCRRALGQPGEARELLERAAATNERLKRTEDWWRNQVALLQLDLAEPEVGKAERRLAALTALAGERPPERGVAAVLAHEGARLEWQGGRYAEALALADRALGLFREAGDAAGVAAVRVVQGGVWTAQGRKAEAETAWREALGEFERLGQPRGVAVALAGLGGVLSADPGRREEAERVLRRAIDNLRALRMESEARAAEDQLARARDTAKGEK